MRTFLQDADRFRCNRYALTESLCVVAVAGDVDLDTAPTMERVLLAALSADVTDVVVDVTDVTLLDSTGLSALVRAWQVAGERGGTIRLSGTPRCVEKVLSITGLDQILPSYDDLPAAVAACGLRLAPDAQGSLLKTFQAIGDEPTTPAA